MSAPLPTRRLKRGDSGHELLYPHEISARIHGQSGTGKQLILQGNGNRLVRASEHNETEEYEAPAPKWLEDLEMENQKSIAFMARLISGRPQLSADPQQMAHGPSTRRHKHTVGVLARAPRRAPRRPQYYYYY